MSFCIIFCAGAVILLIAAIFNRISKSKSENFKKRDN